MQSPDITDNVLFSPDIYAGLQAALGAIDADRAFFLFDENTNLHCRPLLGPASGIDESNTLVLDSGEENKNIEQVRKAWDFLEYSGAGRNSVLVTIGGGMLTDLGGFAACTFKRGIHFVNIPTTLLAMVDASVGGKTGINYRGLKNEIGVIRQPDKVLIHTQFLETLDRENIISGFAEMLKAGLIMDAGLWDQLRRYDLSNQGFIGLLPMIRRSVEIKKTIVDIDPEEKADRRALNFGHTFAHAFESLSLERNNHLHHGYAVAYGMVFESRLSEISLDFPHEDFLLIQKTIDSIYGPVPFLRKDSDSLIRFMRADKKNDTTGINFTLLERVGKYRINNYFNSDLVREVLGELLTS